MPRLLIDVAAKRLGVSAEEANDLLRRLRQSRLPGRSSLRERIEAAIGASRGSNVVTVDDRDARVLARVLSRPPRLRSDLRALLTEIELQFHVHGDGPARRAKRRRRQ